MSLSLLLDALLSPFTDFEFMRRGILASLCLSLSVPLVGVFVLLRRMSLVGDAMAHAILPGVALAVGWKGFNILAMWAGGVGAGLGTALLAGRVSRHTILSEETALGTFYLMALAAGILILSLLPTPVDMMHILFGSILAIDSTSLGLLFVTMALTLSTLAVLYRGLIAECCDPDYFRRCAPHLSAICHHSLTGLMVLNLVSGFQAMGTLLTVGLMILPAATARLLCVRLESMLLLAPMVALGGSVAGLWLSFTLNVPSGPCMILTLGGIYLLGLGKRLGGTGHGKT